MREEIIIDVKGHFLNMGQYLILIIQREIEMAKNYRGKGIKNLPAHGRGECPVCHRTGVKVLHEVKAADKTVKVCKVCKGVAAAKLSA